MQEFTTSGEGTEEDTEQIHDQMPQNNDKLNRQSQSHAYIERSNVNREQRNKQQRMEVQVNMTEQTVYQQDAINRSGIDSMLTLPTPLHIDTDSVGVVVGGEVGSGQ